MKKISKKYIIIFVVLLIILQSCDINIVNYTLTNKSSYDLHLIDNNDKDKTEYEIKSNESLFINHVSWGSFSIKERNIPVYVQGGIDSSTVYNLDKYILRVKNYTDNNILVKILNTDFNNQFSISSNSQDVVEIYTQHPEISSDSPFLLSEKNGELYLIFM